MFGITGPTDCHAVPGDWGNDESPTREELKAWFAKRRQQIVAALVTEFNQSHYADYLDIDAKVIDDHLQDAFGDAVQWERLS